MSPATFSERSALHRCFALEFHQPPPVTGEGDDDLRLI
jgi:hypothetical protein